LRLVATSELSTRSEASCYKVLHGNTKATAKVVFINTP